MAGYSPFNVDLRQLKTGDLAVLRTVSEGWYVEYKSKVSSASAVAKSVSAFSNTYGGWLFYGVNEKSRAEPVAGTFPGIARADIDACRQCIQQAVATHVTPSPHFEMHLLWEPCEEIELPKDRAVICLHIPQSVNTPHVHKSGQIYRRVADGADPRPENDRFVLDQLWRRGDDLRKHYEKWIDRSLELAEDEADVPYLRLLIVPDLWAEHALDLNLTVNQVREIMRGVGEAGISIPFETVYSSAQGFVARQLQGGSPHQLGLTWRLWPDASSEVLLPFSNFRIDDIRRVAYHLVGFDNSERFQEILISQRYTRATIVDLNLLFHLLIGVSRIQQRLCETAGWKNSWFVKGQLVGVWRTSPFIDVDIMLDLFESHGTPMCLDKKVTIPPGSDPDTFHEIAALESMENSESRIFVKAVFMFGLVARAFGLPGWPDLLDEKDAMSYYQKLQEAGARAIGSQDKRNRRMRARAE